VKQHLSIITLGSPTARAKRFYTDVLGSTVAASWQAKLPRATSTLRRC
jgi:hypothetical protein